MITVARFLRKLACRIGGHEWRTSRFQSLNLLAGERDVVCAQCGKYETLEG